MDSLNFLSPEKVVQIFDLQTGDHVADFGTGHGFFAIQLAKAVGAKGKVYAIDVQKSALDVVRSYAAKEHLANIEPLLADLEHPRGLPIKSDFIDFVLVSNVLFQAENKIGLIKEAYKILRSGGKIAVIEWDNSNTSLGPPPGMRIDKERLKDVCVKINFKFLREFPAGQQHYGMIFRK
ncbi:MAG: methyltransferase domain-containing protein [bacterium]|nr:methyltransferase domain-containing protein [bacterium]